MGSLCTLTYLTHIQREYRWQQTEYTDRVVFLEIADGVATLVFSHRSHPRPGGFALNAQWAHETCGLPLWGIVLLSAIIPAALWWWERRRPYSERYCANCGYDLTGNVSGCCPECGAKIAGDDWLKSAPTDTARRRRLGE